MSEELQQDGDDEIISIELGDRTILVARSQIRWVQAAGDYARLHTPERSYLLRQSLNRLEERWGKYGFIRTHRKYLVPLSLVTELRKGPSGHNVRLGSGPSAKDIPVSRRQLKELRQRWVQDREA